MNKIRILALMLAALFLVGCSPVEMLNPTVATFSTEPASFVEESSTKQDWISQEQAMIAGFLVTERGDVRHNQKAWLDFLSACDRGEQTTVRAIRYWNDGTQSVYDVSYDGTEYKVVIQIHGETTILTCTDYLWESGVLGEEEEPYDRFLRCSLTGEKTVVLYEDLIAEPDYAGITGIDLHLKEGEPPLKTFEGEGCSGLLALLTGAEYMTCPPEEYLLGVKLILQKGEGEPLVLEMDLQQGLFRFGEQYYRYAEDSDAPLRAIGWEQWHDAVKTEYDLP